MKFAYFMRELLIPVTYIVMFLGGALGLIILGLAGFLAFVGMIGEAWRGQ